ncbi:hypothetical protein C5E05_02500 [Pseudoclavibacter sp. AY1H1]|nr:hypothetical protein C5E05_02500 [Pseudoclavibacter sp. AY1H1]
MPVEFVAEAVEVPAERVRTRHVSLTQRVRRAEGQNCRAQHVLLVRQVGEGVEDLRDMLRWHSLHLLEDAVGGVLAVQEIGVVHGWFRSAVPVRWAAGRGARSMRTQPSEVVCGPTRTATYFGSGAGRGAAAGEQRQGEWRSFERRPRLAGCRSVS